MASITPIVKSSRSFIFGLERHRNSVRMASDVFAPVSDVVPAAAFLGNPMGVFGAVNGPALACEPVTAMAVSALHVWRV